MDRTQWLQERRRVTELRFDTVYAPTYDRDDSPISPTHRRFVADLIQHCPRGGQILDAACGTGKYFAMILGRGRRVTGCDQSAAMLAKAAEKYPSVSTHKIGLQELDYESDYHAAMCVDALENVSPEDWPRVLSNLRRSLRPGGYLYLTVETTSDQALAEAYADATAQGLPVVPGEDASRGEGYHYYPPHAQVTTWLTTADLEIVHDAHSAGDHPSYGYHHVLTRTREQPPD